MTLITPSYRIYNLLKVKQTINFEYIIMIYVIIIKYYNK